MRQIDHIVIHHSASPLITTAMDIRDWHLAQGWNDIGYHWVIQADGKRVAGRPWQKIGAHVQGFNQRSLGICLVGDNTDPRETWTWDQRRAGKMLVEGIRVFYPEACVVGHRDVQSASTECPGVDAREMLGV